MLVSCVVGVLLDVVLSAVSATLREGTIMIPENKQADDAGSRLFWEAFLCGPLVWNYSSAEREGLSTDTCTTGMPSRTPFAQHPVTKNLPTSPQFSPTMFYRDANSVLLRAQPLYSSRLYRYAQNPVFETVHAHNPVFEIVELFIGRA